MVSQSETIKDEEQSGNALGETAGFSGGMQRLSPTLLGMCSPVLGEAWLFPLSVRTGRLFRHVCPLLAVDRTGMVWFWNWQRVPKFTASPCVLACA